MLFIGNVVCGCLEMVHYSVTMVDFRPYSCHISFVAIYISEIKCECEKKYTKY